MAHTFTQVYIQAVFAVAVRQSLIRPDFKEELQKYITGIVRKKGQKLIEINCMPDHTHMLIGLKPSIALSDLMRDVKSTRPSSSDARDGSEGGSTGRRVLAHSPTRIRTWPR